MNAEIPNFTGRQRELELLRASADKTEAALRVAQISVQQLQHKLVRKLAELRMQTQMLHRAQSLATRAEIERTVAAMQEGAI